MVSRRSQPKNMELYFVDWVDFYIIGGLLPKDHLSTWLSSAMLVKTAFMLTTVELRWNKTFEKNCKALAECERRKRI